MQFKGRGIDKGIAVFFQDNAHLQALLRRLPVQIQKRLYQLPLLPVRNFPVNDYNKINVAVFPGKAAKGDGTVHIDSH